MKRFFYFYSKLSVLPVFFFFCWFYVVMDDITEGLFVLLMVAVVLILVVDLYGFVLVGVGVRVLSIPPVDYFSRLLGDVFISVAIVDEDLGGSIKFLGGGCPGGAMGHCPTDVGPDGRILVSVGTLTQPIQAEAEVGSFSVDRRS